MLTQNMWSTDAEMVVRNKSAKLLVLEYALFTTDDHICIVFLLLTTTSELLYAQFD